MAGRFGSSDFSMTLHPLLLFLLQPPFELLVLLLPSHLALLCVVDQLLELHNPRILGLGLRVSLG